MIKCVYISVIHRKLGETQGIFSGFRTSGCELTVGGLLPFALSSPLFLSSPFPFPSTLFLPSLS